MRAKSDVARYIVNHLRALNRVERAVKGDYRQELKQVIDEAAEAFEQGGGIDFALRAHRARIENAVFKTAQISIPLFFQRGVIAVGVDQKRRHQSGFRETIAEWMEESGLAEAALISSTTREDISRIIQRGIEGGEPVARIATDIRKLGGIAAVTRANTIARTETHNAAMFANQRGAVDSGLDLQKKWVSVEDARTRPWHAAVDSQGYIDMDESYIVNTIPMKRPGDPAGGPSNVINCRCAEIYRPIDSPFN